MEARNATTDEYKALSEKASMGPRLCRRGMAVTRQPWAARVVLQWGRACVGAECALEGGADAREELASMGPRLCRRGMPDRLCYQPHVLLSFNGAAPV